MNPSTPPNGNDRPGSGAERPPPSDRRRVLIFGLGFFERALLQAVCSRWPTIAVDFDDNRVMQLREEIPAAEYMVADASSILTWKKLPLDEVRIIITTIRDLDVNLEVCRIARESLGLEMPILVLLYDPDPEKEAAFTPYNVTLVKPVELGITVILNRLERNYARAIDIGQRKGEIIEVTILSKSHLVDRKLKYLRPSRWQIAALYRAGEFILPDGSTTMRVGDRVVLVGEPKVLENVANILMQGTPQFPVQYGADFVFPLFGADGAHLDEAISLASRSRSRSFHFLPLSKKLKPGMAEKLKAAGVKFDVGESITFFRDVFTLRLNIGVLIVPLSGNRLLRRWRIRTAFRKAHKPFLLSRSRFPYRGIVISLNCQQPVLALETGMEIAHQNDLPFRVIYVQLPRELRGREEEDRLVARQQLVSDFEDIHKHPIEFVILEGNPVRETLHFLESQDNELLILVNNSTQLSVFSPNVPYLISRKTRLSTLVIPGEEISE